MSLFDPDPEVRLAFWQALARNAGITTSLCQRLAQQGYTEAADGLRQAIGESA
jgi:hypothetical protein